MRPPSPAAVGAERPERAESFRLLSWPTMPRARRLRGRQPARAPRDGSSSEYQERAGQRRQRQADTGGDYERAHEKRGEWQPFAAQVHEEEGHQRELGGGHDDE